MRCIFGALAGREKADGFERPSTLDTVSNLGNLYFDQGKMREAEDMYNRRWPDLRRLWGRKIDRRWGL